MAPPCLIHKCLFMSVCQSHWWLCGSYFFLYDIWCFNCQKTQEEVGNRICTNMFRKSPIFELRWSSHFPQTFPHRAVEPGPSFSCYLLIYFFWSAVGAQTVRLQERSNWNENRQCPLCWDSGSLPAPGIREAHGTNSLLGLLT